MSSIGYDTLFVYPYLNTISRFDLLTNLPCQSIFWLLTTSVEWPILFSTFTHPHKSSRILLRPSGRLQKTILRYLRGSRCRRRSKRINIQMNTLVKKRIHRETVMNVLSSDRFHQLSTRKDTLVLYTCTRPLEISFVFRSR